MHLSDLCLFLDIFHFHINIMHMLAVCMTVYNLLLLLEIWVAFDALIASNVQQLSLPCKTRR